MKLSTSQASGAHDQPLLELTIGEALGNTAQRHPEHVALIVRHQGIRWTYAEYLEQVDSLAAGLVHLGIEAGDRVGIWAPNCVEWCLTQFATARIGAIMVCLNPAYRLYELEYALNKVQCKALITAARFKSSDYLDMLQTLAPELARAAPGQLDSHKLPHLKTVIRLGDDESAGMFNFGALRRAPNAADRTRLAAIAATLEPTDAINIQFTSGTTGNPKGATLSHRNILNNGKIVGDGMRLGAHDRLCIPVPLYHCFGMVMGNLACITHGSTAVFPGEAFEPLATLQAVAEERCTALHGVPTMFIAELEHPRFGEFDLGSLRTGIMAGAPCPVEVMNKVLERMHMRDVLIAYGQTETSPVNHMTGADDPIAKRVATVGRPAAHCEIRIIDGEGAVVPTGEKGEICCRGYGVMHGYWDDEERTRETIDRDGWLHSGDIGVMDDEGYTAITGRIKDMIIRGGENIYPREVEEFLYTHPDIQDVQVFGIPDEKYGEQVCAWIKPRPGAMLDAEQLKAFCRKQITHFKVPQYIRFVDEFPMTVTGKIQKFRMREAMIAQLEAAG
ncbi:MAG: AMP-binding protein [Gammaproteobacteria bacterium]|jgi:fatty-acyl-CoA synthase|nr:AMP-binding protein [Gammaproteobacteria bacterium]MBK6584429.1 AMP-binding protein [Gammaproteobacteria bacterium]MBK7168333.1 AMP-binding protein [Gammaproteobacteria bacterium]MBK9667496.1 AMP-binding protein [Gammaproteobacteria bacterium]